MGQGLVHLAFDADIVNHQPLFLALEFSIHAGDGLDQGMPLNGLVDIHGIQKRHIKAGEPHINHNGNLEIRLGALELSVQFLAIVLGAEQVIQLFGVILATGHDHLEPLHGLDLFFLFV